MDEHQLIDLLKGSLTIEAHIQGNPNVSKTLVIQLFYGDEPISNCEIML